MTSAASLIAFRAADPSHDERASHTTLRHGMREFTDASGRGWIASVRVEQGPDYKGRIFLVIQPADGSSVDALELREVRWNSERTARRTLETMSDVELRRRLRAGLGRYGGPLAS